MSLDAPVNFKLPDGWNWWVGPGRGHHYYAQHAEARLTVSAVNWPTLCAEVTAEDRNVTRSEPLD